jgi:hypothetical protein
MKSKIHKHLTSQLNVVSKTNSIAMGFALMLVAGSLTFSSCRKKEKEKIEEPEDTEQGTANDNNLAENFANDIEVMGSQVSENGSIDFRSAGSTVLSGEDLKLAAPCAQVSGVGTATVTVNFGNGCMGLDGRLRSGKLIFNFSASAPNANYYRNPGFSMTVSSLNYVVDGHQVNISNKTITNTTPINIPQGPNPGTNLSWAINANISIVKPNNGGTLTWTCNRTKVLLNTGSANCYQGQSTPINWSNAHIGINGSSSGVNAGGENFSANANNMIKHFDCSPDPNRPRRHPFISGTLTFTPGNRPVRLINYGNVNSCDFNATLTINNNTYTITLP